jgi:hypothetical protein
MGSVPASGKLDASYGMAGKVELAPGARYDNVVVDNEGNAFVGAELFDGSQGYVVKFDPSGAVATAYGDGGRIVVSPNGVWMGAMTLDAAGNLYAATNDLGVVQFDAGGHRAPSVGGNLAPGLPAALVRLTDGTFYMAVLGGGFTGQISSALFKYDRNGRLDASFVGGSIAAGIPVVGSDEPRGVLYVAYRDPQTVRAAVNRFDLGTKVLTGLSGSFVPLCSGSSWGVGMDVDSAHNVYVATTCGDSGAARATIWKFDPFGHLVTAFGNGGSRTAILGPDSTTMSPRVGFVRVGPDGNVYVGGASEQGGCYKLTIAKIDPEGRDVAQFGTGGKLVVDVADSTATKIELDGRGRLYALGYSQGTCSAPSSALPSYFMVRAGA